MFKNPVIKLIEDSIKPSIDLEEAKNFLRIDLEDDDVLIEKLIHAASRQCELSIGKTLITKKYKYSIYNPIQFVKLIYGPVNSIVSVTLIDKENNPTIIDEENYFFDEVGDIINFKDIPQNFYRLDIEYISGFADESDSLPEDLKQAILSHVAKMYDERTSYTPLPKITLDIYKKYKQIRL